MSCPLFPSRVAPQAVTVTVVGQLAGTVTLTLNWHLPCQWLRMGSHRQMCARTDGHQRRPLTRSLAAWAKCCWSREAQGLFGGAPAVRVRVFLPWPARPCASMVSRR